MTEAVSHPILGGWLLFNQNYKHLLAHQPSERPQYCHVIGSEWMSFRCVKLITNQNHSKHWFDGEKAFVTISLTR